MRVVVQAGTDDHLADPGAENRAVGFLAAVAGQRVISAVNDSMGQGMGADER
ncbi:hypothetical protein D3C84_1314790 [compost metagenome]